MAAIQFSFTSVSGATQPATANTIFTIGDSNTHDTVTFNINDMAEGNLFIVSNTKSNSASVVAVAIYNGVFLVTDSNQPASLNVQSGTSLSIFVKQIGSSNIVFGQQA